MPAPVILDVAVNGSTPPARNPHVPRTPGAVTRDLLACIALGATIGHSHTDDTLSTETGVHAVEPYVRARTPVLATHPDVLHYPTTAAGARGIAVEGRWAHVEELARRRLGGTTLVDPGSVDLGLLADGSCPSAAAVGPYQNGTADTEHGCARTAALGAAASTSVVEPGFLRTALTLQRHGRLPAGVLVKLHSGGELEFGLPPTPTAPEAYLELLAPSGLEWSVAVLGGDVVACGLAPHARPPLD